MRLNGQLKVQRKSEIGQDQALLGPLVQQAVREAALRQVT